MDAAAAAAPDGRAEFQEMFVSLVDPAGLVDMEACGRTAALMEEAAQRSGYAAGARMASLLKDIFADVAEIAGRAVDDGARGPADVAYGDMMMLLRDAADAYRAGKGAEPEGYVWRACTVRRSAGGEVEPVAELEDLKRRVARARSSADLRREDARAADPPGSALPVIDRPYTGRICGDVIRERQEDARAQIRAQGHDPVFPPKARPITFSGDAGPGLSLVDTLLVMRGRIPDGYELVRTGSGSG